MDCSNHGIVNQQQQPYFRADTLQQASDASQQLQSGNTQAATTAAGKFGEIKDVLGAANWYLIVGCFIFYFLFGYLFYAALFARSVAVGSAVNEDPFAGCPKPYAAYYHAHHNIHCNNDKRHNKPGGQPGNMAQQHDTFSLFLAHCNDGPYTLWRTGHRA